MQNDYNKTKFTSFFTNFSTLESIAIHARNITILYTCKSDCIYVDLKFIRDVNDIKLHSVLRFTNRRSRVLHFESLNHSISVVIYLFKVEFLAVLTFFVKKELIYYIFKPIFSYSYTCGEI